MAFDGIVLNSIVNELKQTIIGSKVNKIYQPTKNNVIFNLYTNGNKFNLNLCVDPKNCRLSLTKHFMENPMQAPSFCMLLRKHIGNSLLVGINTFDLERIVEFEFKNFNEFDEAKSKKLIIEIMAGHSNIILLNNDKEIIDSLRHVASSREIFPGKKYVMPTNAKKSFLLLEDFKDFLNALNYDGSEIDKLMSHVFIGISQSFIKSSIKELGLVSENLSIEDLR